MRRTLTAVGVLLTAVLTSVLAGATVGSAGVERRAGTIAFLRTPESAWNSGVGATSLYRIQADGTDLRRLTPASSSVLSYAWSPDASRIAYTDWRGSLWVIRRNGTGRKLLVPSRQMRGWSVSWSPDGRVLVVLAQTDPAAKPRLLPGSEIYLVPIDRREPHRLPVDDVGGPPGWSPRGDEIAYGSTTGGGKLIRPDGTDARLIAGAGPWSPDGKRLMFGVGRYASISIVDADGRNLHRLTNHAYNEYGGAWSPDGRRILYGRENREGIYVIDADGRHDRRVTRDSPIPVEWGALAWSPDGDTIAYDTDRTGGGDIYVIGADGRDRVQLTSSSDVDVAPSWAPR